MATETERVGATFRCADCENTIEDVNMRITACVHCGGEMEIVTDDVDRVSVTDRAELVASAARDTKSIFRAARTRLQIAGHGYQVNLPPAEDAGFEEGDLALVHSESGMLVITTDERQASRLAADLVTIRRGQVST